MGRSRAAPGFACVPTRGEVVLFLCKIASRFFSVTCGWVEDGGGDCTPKGLLDCRLATLTRSPGAILAAIELFRKILTRCCGIPLGKAATCFLISAERFLWCLAFFPYSLC